MKFWQCARCGHVVLSDDRPVLRWDDGHSCIFLEQPDPVTTFREINDAFYDGDHPIDGINTTLDTSGRFCNLVIYENGNVLAAVSEYGDLKVKVLLGDGTALNYSMKDKGEIISEIKKRSKVLA